MGWNMKKKEYKKDYNRPDYGSRDDKGHWKPPYPCGYAPLFSEKFKLRNLFKFLFGWDGYLFPRTFGYILLASGTYFLLRIEIANFVGLSFGFILHMLLRNLAMIVIVYSAYHLYLYTFKKKATTRNIILNGCIKMQRSFCLIIN